MTEDSNMLVDNIIQHIMSQFKGVHIVNAWGEISFFYNPEGLLKRGIYFATIKEKNGANDSASYLDRNGIFRINFGITKQSFLDLFNTLPKRPVKGGIIDGDYDFKKLDTLTPHPVYGWMAWVSILNPSYNSWQDIQILLTQSYTLAIEKYKKKLL